MKTRYSAILSFIILLVVFAPACMAHDEESTQGELKIEGSHIERLVLRTSKGQTQTINKPGEIIVLPVGTYYLQQIDLIGFFGYTINKRIIITEDEQAILKAGAPLKQTIDIKRQGKCLVLSYKLTGIGGEGYREKTFKNLISLYIKVIRKLAQAISSMAEEAPARTRGEYRQQYLGD